MAHARENALLLSVVGAKSAGAGGRRESLLPPENHGRAGRPDGVCDLDWAYVLAAADRQGITPLLAHHATRGRLAIPPPIAERATATYWEAHFRNRALRASLQRILAAAAEIGLPVMPLKGAALINWYYPAPALRPMSDLDLLVPPGEEARFGALLGSLGFTPVPYGPPLVGGGRADTTGAEFAAVGTFGGISVLVEYRTEPLDPAVGSLIAAAPRVAMRLREHAERMWQRATDAMVDGAPCARIAPGDLLLHVGSHLTTRHAGLRLLWLHDLHTIVAAHGDALDWDAIGARARDLTIEHPVGAALAAAHRWLGTPLPDVPVARWHNTGGALGSRIERRMLAARVASLGTADLAAQPGAMQGQQLAIAAARLQAARSLGRAARWMALPRREYMAWWCAAPVVTAGDFLRAVALRAAYTALAALVPPAQRRHLPGRRAADALLSRMRTHTRFAPADR